MTDDDERAADGTDLMPILCMFVNPLFENLYLFFGVRNIFSAIKQNPKKNCCHFPTIKAMNCSCNSKNFNVSNSEFFSSTNRFQHFQIQHKQKTQKNNIKMRLLGLLSVVLVGLQLAIANATGGAKSGGGGTTNSSSRRPGSGGVHHLRSADFTLE
jgi:hypothetical protein